MAPVRISRRTGVKMSNKVATLLIIILVSQFVFMLYIFVQKDNQLESKRRELLNLMHDLEGREDEIRSLNELIKKLEEKSKILEVIEDLNSGLTTDEEQRIARVVWQQADLYECSPFVILALIITESSFRPNAVSSKNAQGLMQVKPELGKELIRDLAKRLTPEDMAQLGLVDEVNENILMNPEINVKLGMFYLAQLIVKFDGNLKNAVRAYNAGPYRVARRIRKGRPLPRRYLNRVVRNYKMLQNKYGVDTVEESPEADKIKAGLEKVG
jgi:peptidoglycan lytic transglycosylase